MRFGIGQLGAELAGVVNSLVHRVIPRLGERGREIKSLAINASSADQCAMDVLTTSFTRNLAIEFASDFVPVDAIAIGASIMPLVVLKADGSIHPIGTCFSITDFGLCLTALHVIEEALPNSVRAGATSGEDDGWLYALYSSPVPNPEPDIDYIGGLIPVQQIYVNSSLDIAVVQLGILQNAETGQRLPTPAHKLGLGLPTVGEHCFGFGYHHMSWSATPTRAEYDHAFSASRGVVEELHVPKRDQQMLPFPCFRTSARYDGGMSGGPVMGMDGLVHGVICSSLGADEQGHISYASLVAPAMLINVNWRVEGQEEERGFLFQLAELGYVRIERGGTEIRFKDDLLEVWLAGVRITNRVTP